MNMANDKTLRPDTPVKGGQTPINKVPVGPGEQRGLTPIPKVPPTNQKK
jgi:hypothetical protein